MRNCKPAVLFVIALSFAACASTQSRIVKEKEQDPQYQFEKASVAMNYGLVDQALEYLNQALALDPGHAASYNLLGLAYTKKGEYEAAVDAFQKCLELSPDFPDTHNHLGVAYQELGMLEEAEEAYKKAVVSDESFASCINLASLSFEQNKLEQALSYVRLALQKDNRSLLGFNLQGVILNKMGRYPEAINSFLLASRLAPEDVTVGINLGIAYFNSGNMEKAREAFMRALPIISDPQLRKRVEEYLDRIKSEGAGRGQSVSVRQMS